MVRNGTFKAFECKTDNIDEVYQRFMSITNIFIYKFLEADESIKEKYNCFSCHDFSNSGVDYYFVFSGSYYFAFPVFFIGQKQGRHKAIH